MNVTKKIMGPLEIIIDVNRCDLEMKHCEKYPGHHFKEVCKRLMDTKSFYYGSLSGVQPPLVCPMLPQLHEVKNQLLDLSAISLIPISDYIWIATIKMISSSDTKRKEVQLCLLVEMKITRSRSKKRT